MLYSASSTFRLVSNSQNAFRSWGVKVTGDQRIGLRVRVRTCRQSRRASSVVQTRLRQDAGRPKTCMGGEWARFGTGKNSLGIELERPLAHAPHEISSWSMPSRLNRAQFEGRGCRHIRVDRTGRRRRLQRRSNSRPPRRCGMRWRTSVPNRCVGCYQRTLDDFARVVAIAASAGRAKDLLTREGLTARWRYRFRVALRRPPMGRRFMSFFLRAECACAVPRRRSLSTG
jgi:hypothetical protein